MSKKKEALVVPHTHWDRDWYWPIERFRVRLIDMFSKMLELFEQDADYRFSMDGQVIPIEDYLEAHPEDRATLKRLGDEGRLVAGPMYVLSDLYCTGGEALIRNLLIGTEMASGLASEQKMLHMPDTFGILPCIPMIAKGFGFDCFTFMRGSDGAVPSDLRMFIWKCPDGSSVRVFRLRDGYANAARLGFDPKEKGVEKTYKEHLAARGLKKAAKRQDDKQGEPLLLLAGVDHQIPQDLGGAMKRASKKGPYRFKYAKLDDLADGVAKKDASGWLEYEGEFHGTGAASVLGGTVSTRPYLKQTNAEVERLIAGSAERADGIVFLTGKDDPASGSINIAWKSLLKTHPHDDMCGCSVDSVHRDNEYDMRQARDAADAVERRMAENLLRHFGGNAKGDERYSFFLFNTQPTRQHNLLRLKIDFEGRENWGDLKVPDAFAIVDEKGEEVPFQLVEKARSIEHPHPYIVVDLDADLAPFSMERFYFEERKRWAKTVKRQARVLENGNLKATVKLNGTVDVFCKPSGREWKGLGVFSNQADVGDTYDFADIVDEQENVFDNLRFKDVTKQSGGLSHVTLEGALQIPEFSEGESRSGRNVALPVEIVYSLGENAKELETRISFTNKARDHRLRWNMPFDFKPRKTRAGLKFNELERPAGRQPKRKTAPRVHPIHPMDHFVAVENREGGLAVFSEFPMNYECVNGQDSRLALTLLRAVGQLSRNNLSTRKSNDAGPSTLTPEAQCLGREFSYRFAIRPFDNSERDELMGESMLWRERPVFGVIMAHYPERKKRGNGPVFMEADGSGLVLTALKRKQRGGGVVFRVLNTRPETIKSRLVIRNVDKLIPLGLNEVKTGEKALMADSDGSFSIQIAPFGLATFEIAADSPWQDMP